MRRNNQNNDNRYYAYLPPTNSITSRNSSSNSTNQNTHYHYYDPRLRTQQQAQQTLYEYQYSNTSPNRSLNSLYGSPHSQHHYQPPSFIPELSSSSTTVSDLGEPISVFHDIQPLEHRRSIVAPPPPSLSSTYVPPDPTRRTSVSDVRLATAHVLREQLLTDIQETISDIDRDMNSLERRPFMPRYLPPRFSPIIELDTQDDNLFHQTRPMKRSVNISSKKPNPKLTSPVHKQMPQTSAHSTATTTKDRNSGNSQFWPNKPKRVYEVIPRLTSDSKRTSRQSSVGEQQEQMKIPEIYTPQSRPKTMEKHMSSSSLQLRSQYHYGPEVEEIEILSNDPENSDHKSTFEEIQEGTPYETLNTDQFLRDQTSPPDNRAMIFLPQYSGDSQIGFHELTEDLIPNDKTDTNIAQSSTVNSFQDLTSTKEMNIRNMESLIQTAPEVSIKPEPKPRIASRSTITPHESYHETETDLTKQDNPTMTVPVKHSRPLTTITEPVKYPHPSTTITEIVKHSIPSTTITETVNQSHPSTTITEIVKHSIPSTTTTPIASDDLHEKSSSLQLATHDSTVVVPTHPSPPPGENNVSGLVAYFFSDYGNEGEGEEDLIQIDQSNFAVPTGAEIISDDDLSNTIMSQSQPSLLILHSAHVPHQQQQQQQQQQFTTTLPSTKETNNERIKFEEKEEIKSEETDARKQRISTTTSILPSSSPSPKQVLPTSIIDDMRTQFTRNNNTNNDDEHQRRRSTSSLNMNAIDSNLEEQDKRSNNSQIRQRSSLSSKIHSRTPSAKSERYDEQINKNYEESRITPLSNTSFENLDDEHPERNNSADQRVKSSSRTLSRRTLSSVSNHTKNDGEITRIDSSSKSSLKNYDRENSTSRRSISRQPSIAPSEQSHLSQQRFPPSRPSSNHHEIGQSFNIVLRGQSVTSPNDRNKTPINGNEPNTFSVESEHFLHNKPESTYDLNQRLPSGYSVSQPGDSRRSSAASTTLPVTLDSPDIDNNPQPTSRTRTPDRKNSIASIESPPDPNVLITTTDDMDPDDPSNFKSTIRFQMLSSQLPNTDISSSEHDAPSPLLNIVPLQEFPPPVESLPMDEHSREPSPTAHDSSLDNVELEPETDLRPPSISLSNHEQQEPIRHTSTPSKPGNQQELSRQSPLLSYPTSLEDLMRPTPPLTHEQNGRLSSATSPINETKDHNHYRIQSPSKFESNHIHSTYSSPRNSESPDSNHTSIEVEDSYRQQIDLPTISPKNEKIISPDHNNNQKRISPPPSPVEPKVVTIHHRQHSSEKSASPIHLQHEQQDDEPLHRNDIQLSLASIKYSKHHYSPPSSPVIRPTSDEEELPTMTASQQHSKLSLRLRQKEPKRKKTVSDQPSAASPVPQIDTEDMSPVNTDDNLVEHKPKRRQRRRVSFSSSIARFQMEERQLFTNWRERVASILASKHQPNEKYAHVASRVNSFANFEYQPRKIKVIPKKKNRPTLNKQTNIEQSKFIKRKKFKVKKPKTHAPAFVEEHTDDEQQQGEEEEQTQPVKDTAPQLFGRLWCLPDGSPTVFHQPLDWNAESRLKTYSYENLNYEPHRSDFKIYNKKPKWHSESKLADLLKESPRLLHRQIQILSETTSLPLIPDRDRPYYRQQQSYREPLTQRKIFDIQTNIQPQSDSRLQRKFSGNLSYGSRPSDVPIFNEKLLWSKKSKLKETTWQNISYQPKKSKVQIFHKSVHWNSEPKIRIRSPSTIHQSRASMSNVQIFDEKLNWDSEAKVHCWSEIDLRQLTRKKAIFAQYRDPKWNDIVTARVDATNYNYPKLSNNVEIVSDRLMWTRNSTLKGYVWENFDYKTHHRTRRQSNDRRHLEDIDQSPPNRPKWNAVSKTRSVNSVYNPKVTNSNTIRRGWDRDLRRKRVHQLPPLKRKREHEELPHLTINAPPSTLASMNQLAIDYTNDHSSTQDYTTSNGYATTSSRRSSKALVPLNHHGRFSELELPNETSRSQRPVQQEWYDDMNNNKSRQTHRTDMGRTTKHSFRGSIDSIHQPNTPRELITFRSSTRNSQNSVMSGTLLDSSIRSNRATELRLLKDMDEHHHHSHTPSQSMPIEIRGFKLEGTQLTVSDHATIRPLSNVSYQTSERVKSRRVYPWSSLHPHGTSSRNSSLVPIAELRRPSLDTTITEAQQLIHEE